MLRELRSRWHKDITGIIDDKFIKNTYSLLQNEYLMRNGYGSSLKESKQYDRIKQIRDKLIVMDVDDEGTWIRIGSENDGGYVMWDDFCKKQSGIAYSLGIGNNVDWDIEMAQKGYDIYQYDHTIKALPMDNERFHWEKIGITGGEETVNIKKLDNLIKNNGHDKQHAMILKMDIEGFEWSVLNDIDSGILMLFDQIVLELHGILTRSEKEITDALEKLNLSHQLVHIHANNNAVVEYCSDLFLQNLLEVTYLLKSKYNFKMSARSFPTLLDAPVVKYLPDICLGNWNQ